MCDSFILTIVFVRENTKTLITADFPTADGFIHRRRKKNLQQVLFYQLLLDLQAE
jgi:hypothetical protein